MASRKDKKGRVLRKGETYREDKQMYEYRYTDSSKKRRSIYAKDLAKLRENENQEFIWTNDDDPRLHMFCRRGCCYEVYSLESVSN